MSSAATNKISPLDAEPSANSTVPRMNSSEGRWCRLGPWYAMFPMDFALKSIQQHTAPGDAVLDPFMGRGTTLSASAILGRNAAGIEINPVAWVYAQAKISPASHSEFKARLHEIGIIAKDTELPELPEFFQWAFCPEVLRFLVTAQNQLDWKHSKVDCTLMALILTDLHGKDGVALSNQMLQTKSVDPNYAIRWWKQRKMLPRVKDPVTTINNRAFWRYRHGQPDYQSRILAIHGDSTQSMQEVASVGPYKLLLTSPPYYNLVNYSYDQWLRRWMLGGPPHPQSSHGEWQNKFGSRTKYEQLLVRVFSDAAPYLSDDAVLVVRTDARKFTMETTMKVLAGVFPNKMMQIEYKPTLKPTQTALFGDKREKPGEVDLILS